MATAGKQWWVFTTTLPGQQPTYSYVYETAAQAQADSRQTLSIGGQKNLYGPYATRAQAQAAVKAGNVTPQNSSPGPSVPSPLTGLAAIGDFFSRLTQASTWIRAGKVLIGGLLVVVGLAHITGASGAVADYARKVPLPV